MVERCLAKADIAGPNPVSRSSTSFFERGIFYVVGIRTRVGRGNPRIRLPLDITSAQKFEQGVFYIVGIRPRGLR